MNKQKREQVEKLALWLSTCPIGDEPICYLDGHYKSLQILYPDFIDVFETSEIQEVNVNETWELQATLNGTLIFCLVSLSQIQVRLNWEDFV